MKVTCSYKSEIGKVRKSNEDSLLVDRDHFLFMIADGIGGLARGKETSEMAIRLTHENILYKFNNLEPEMRIQKSMNFANHAIYTFAKQNRQDKGVGTTLTTLFLYGNNYYLGHVGDTRCYLLRGSTMQIITEDQTVINELLKKGEISVEEAELHPEKQILTEALGVNSTANILTYRGKIEEGDIFILCSDGLYDYLYESEIVEEVRANKQDIFQANENLFSIVNLRGAEDNISIIIVKILKI